jgi:hypothetical protein
MEDKRPCRPFQPTPMMQIIHLSKLFRDQLNLYHSYLRQGTAEGIVFCSSTVGDADLETNRILKEFIARYGQTELDG